MWHMADVGNESSWYTYLEGKAVDDRITSRQDGIKSRESTIRVEHQSSKEQVPYGAIRYRGTYSYIYFRIRGCTALARSWLGLGGRSSVTEFPAKGVASPTASGLKRGRKRVRLDDTGN